MAHALLAAAAATVSRAARAVNTVAAADPVVWGTPVLLGHGRYLAPALTALPNPATGRLDAVLTTTDNGTVRTTDGGLTCGRASGVGGGLDGLLTAGPVPHTFGDTEDRYQGTKRPFFDF